MKIYITQKFYLFANHLLVRIWCNTIKYSVKEICTLLLINNTSNINNINLHLLINKITSQDIVRNDKSNI